ncbi:MAG TPA: RNA methyltransferase [Euzebyales bacterium]
MTSERPAAISHPAVKAARRLRRRRERAASGRLLVEGPNAVDEALDALVEVFVAPDVSDRVRATVARCVASGVPVRPVDDRALDALADARTPQGIVGVATRPAPDLDALADATLLVVLDQVADPGNLGTVIRTADAAGADGVVLTHGSVDPTNAKVVRASAGSLFHLAVVDDVEPAALAAHCRHVGMRLVGAVADARRRYDDMSWSPPTAIVFGNEAHGLSAAMQRQIATSVSVPIRRPSRRGYRGHAESLNLATTAAIVVFEVARQRGT